MLPVLVAEARELPVVFGEESFRAGGEGARGGTDAIGGGVELLVRGEGGGGVDGRRSASSGVICVVGVAGARIAA